MKTDISLFQTVKITVKVIDNFHCFTGTIFRYLWFPPLKGNFTKGDYSAVMFIKHTDEVHFKKHGGAQRGIILSGMAKQTNNHL